MARNIIILCGSPRPKGNTNSLVAWVAQAARQAGARVEVVNTVGIESRSAGCRCCLACQASDLFECVIQDEVSDLVKKVLDFDTVVFATPVYFFNVCAQLKQVMDRCFCHIKMNPDDGSFVPARSDTRFGLIATAGGGMDGGLGLTRDTVKMLADFTGRPFHALLMPLAPNDPHTLQSDTAWQEKACQFGRELAS